MHRKKRREGASCVFREIMSLSCCDTLFQTEKACSDKFAV